MTEDSICHITHSLKLSRRNYFFRLACQNRDHPRSLNHKVLEGVLRAALTDGSVIWYKVSKVIKEHNLCKSS